MDAVIGELITAGATTETQLVITNAPTEGNVVHFVKVVSGTVKFGVNDVHASAHGWASSDTVPPITCPKGTLYFQAASALDTFVVTC